VKRWKTPAAAIALAIALSGCPEKTPTDGPSAGAEDEGAVAAAAEVTAAKEITATNAAVEAEKLRKEIEADLAKETE
jgi:hypothetical protein